MLNTKKERLYNYIINLANQFIKNKNITKIINDTIIENEYFKISTDIYDFEKYCINLINNFKSKNKMIKLTFKDELDLFFNIVYQKNLFLIQDKKENKYYLASLRLSKELINSPTTIIIYDFYSDEDNQKNTYNYFLNLFDLLNIKIGKNEEHFTLSNGNNVKCNIKNKNYIVNLKAIAIVRKNSVINDNKNKPLKNNTILYEIINEDYRKYFNFYYDVKKEEIIFINNLFENINNNVLIIPKLKDGFYIESNYEIKIDNNYTILFDFNNIKSYSLIKDINLMSYLNEFILENEKQINNFYKNTSFKFNFNIKFKTLNPIFKKAIKSSLANELYYIFYQFINGYRSFYFSSKNIIYLISINIFDKLFANYNKNWGSCLYNRDYNIADFINYPKSTIPIIFYAIDVNKILENNEINNINEILSNTHKNGKYIILRGIMLFDFNYNKKNFDILVGGIYKSGSCNYNINTDIIDDIHRFLTKLLIYMLYKYNVIDYNKFTEMINKENEIIKKNPIKKINNSYKFGIAEGSINYLISFNEFSDELNNLMKAIKNNLYNFNKILKNFVSSNKEQIDNIAAHFDKIFNIMMDKNKINEDYYDDGL